MNTNKNILKICLLTILALTTLTGCLEKRKNVEINKDEYQITVNVKEITNYRLSQNLKDFRSSREDAMIIGKDFFVSIDISDEMDYLDYKGDFEKLKAYHSKDPEFKEVTYSKAKGFQRYNESYIRYEVTLPIKDDKKNCLTICIYSSANKKELAKMKYESNEVQDILNHITVKKVKKTNKK